MLHTNIFLKGKSKVTKVLKDHIDSLKGTLMQI